MIPNSSIELLGQPTADPVCWISDRLSDFAKDVSPGTRVLTSSKLDRYLQSIHAEVEVEMENLATTIDIVETQMMQNVSRIITEASCVSLELSTCKAQLLTLLERLRAIGADQLSSLSILSDVDALKRRLGACRKVLTELNQWDVRCRELELLLKALLADHPASFSSSTESGDTATPNTAGSLGQAVSHLVVMKETASTLENLPQFEGKLKWVQNYENRLLSACRSRIYSIVASNSLTECVQCVQVFKSLNRASDFLDVLAETYSEIFASRFEYYWRKTRFICQSVSVDSSPAQDDTGVSGGEDEGEMILSYFKESTSKLEQGAHLLKMSCSIAVGKPDQENNVITATTRKIIRGLLEAPTPDIEQLGEKLFSIENNENLAASILQSLQVGFNIVSATPLIGEIEQNYQKDQNKQTQFWDEFCLKIIPMKLITSMVSLCNRRLENMMKDSPPLRANWSPTQTIVEVESDAERLLRAISSMGLSSINESSTYTLPYLEFHVAAIVPELLLAIDQQLEQYWKRYKPLLSLFENTIKSKWESASANTTITTNHGSIDRSPLPPPQVMLPLLSIDPSILKPCVQLTQMLTSSCQTALHHTYKQLWRPALSAWNRPSRFNIASRQAVLQSLPSRSSSYKHIVSHLMESSDDVTQSSSPPKNFLPKSTHEFNQLVTLSRDTVVFCTIYPIQVLMKAYSAQKFWTSHYTRGSTLHTTTISDSLSSPTSFATSVGEYLLGAVPHFYGDSSGRQSNHNDEDENPLDLVLHRASNEFAKAVKQIVAFSSMGLLQLQSDVRYLDRAFDALGYDSEKIKLINQFLNSWISKTDRQLLHQSTLVDGDNIFSELMID